MIRTREDSFFKIRSAVPEFFPLLLLLVLASFFLRPPHLTGDLVKGISAISTDFTSIISTISGEDHEHASLDAVDQKQPKFRKKFQHLNDATSDLQPFQKRVEIRYHLPASNPSGYETPHFYSGQHAFLYRLTYF
ncbi:hypothetical protein [Pedobacter agri]|uniref:hypothetical protein n=1 Tax=Pedobacter agri TaxID=454586 RepID=UPI00292E1964|nr:hypothetical protein [Pedobacter agri]